MATQFKEKYAYVGDINEQISVELIIDGKPTRCDITHEVKEACESITPEIVSIIRDLITTFDPEFQTNLQENVLIAGCVSRIKGMTYLIEHSLANLGNVNVNVVDDPVFAGAVGALKLGVDMPLSEWQQM